MQKSRMVERLHSAAIGLQRIQPKVRVGMTTVEVEDVVDTIGLVVAVLQDVSAQLSAMDVRDKPFVRDPES